MTHAPHLQAIRHRVMWTRLISVVEEQFDMEFVESDFEPHNFVNLSTIARVVAKRLPGSGPPDTSPGGHPHEIA